MSTIDTVTPTPEACQQGRPARSSRVWWWVVVAFAVQITVWTVWFMIAARAPVAEVPLATRSVR